MKVRFILLALAITYLTAHAHENARSSGIGVRGSLWEAKGQSTEIIVDGDNAGTQVTTSGGGGSLYLFSRTSDNTLIEVTLGALGNARTQQKSWYDEKVDVNALTLATVGLKQELFSLRNPSTLRPYITIGAGPYWIHTVLVQDYYNSENVTVKSKPKRGGYLGGGFNFMFNDWFGLNLDCRYHFINFDKKNEYSGFETGLGLVLLWGRYR
jgi:outer membrane protein W